MVQWWMDSASRKRGGVGTRDWVVFTLVFLGVLGGAMIHTAWQPRVYEAAGTFRFQSSGDTGSHYSGAGMGDWRQMKAELKTTELIQRVVTGRFTRMDQADFLAPYACSKTVPDVAMIERLIRENQKVSFDGLERAVSVRFQHPDRRVAARIVNLLIDEMVAYQARLRIDESLKQVEELRVRAESQQRHVRELTAEMRDRHEKISGAPIEEDAQYHLLQKRHMDAQKMQDALIRRTRDTTMPPGMVTMRWRATDQAVPPDESDYLKRPIVARLIWGLLLALSCGFVAAWGVRKCGRRNSDADVVEGAAHEGGGS